MSRGSRVLVLNERDPAHPKAGGAEIHVAETFGRLAARGYEVTLAASSFAGCAPRETIAGIEVRRLGALPLYYPRVAGLCALETRRGRFDLVVECLNKVPFYSPVYSAAPVLALCHHLFGETAFMQVAWPIAAAVWLAERAIPALYRRRPFVAISESSRDDLARRGIPRERIRVIHCGIEAPKLEVDPARPAPDRVAYLGRLEPYKNVDLLLRAMARLAERFPRTEIVVIGRGSAQSELEALARELGIAERTRFMGFVSNAERNRLLAETRVCVCPSAKEGWGLTVIESNAVATPVVATDAPGLRDSVRPGETGFLVPEGDVEAFSTRIAELLDDDVLATRMSAAALAWSGRFSWDRCASEMAEALDAARAGT
ncbi:MAG: glycosyltransferase family 4 protein [Myxococcales bacterium]|nr:glycosyltransferase family 4 protein [Myxococcales bacterium]